MRLKKAFYIFSIGVLSLFIIKTLYYGFDNNGVPGLDLFAYGLIFFLILLSIISVYFLIVAPIKDSRIRVILSLLFYILPFRVVFFGTGDGNNGLIDFDFSILKYLNDSSTNNQFELFLSFIVPPIFLSITLYKIYTEENDELF